MIKVGLTGGIGSGKSVVAEIFRMKGIPVYVADTESKRLAESSPEIREFLIDYFGDKIYQDGKLNRPLMAKYIFNNKVLLKKVNSVIHPVVLADFEKWAARQESEIVVIETAILFESKFDKKVNYSLMVYTPEEIRFQRVLQRDNLSSGEVRQRMNNQLSDEKKCEWADFVIHNTDREALLPQVEAFVKRLIG